MISPAHKLIPAVVDAVRGGALQRGTIRAALEAEGVAVGESTLSGLLRLAVAQGFLARTGEKKGTRYAIAKWRKRRIRPVEELEPATVPELPTFEDL